MVKIKPIEKIVMRYVRGSLEAFLDDKKELDWIKGTIANSGVLNHEGMLQEIFDGLRRYASLPRYKKILEDCRKEGWFKT
jgi:hypothetical protein